jgi:hypothetical protein
MASNITVDTLTKGATTLNTDEIVDTNSNQICKAWVNFNGSGTVAIRDSYNVSSVTDNGTGDFSVNFTAAMPSANYSSVSGAGWDSASTATGITIRTYTRATTYVRITCFYNSTAAGRLDAHYIAQAVFSN